MTLTAIVHMATASLPNSKSSSACYRIGRSQIANDWKPLKYLVHFIGDVHQPLHASNDHDRGGNDVAVKFMGLPTNLHAVWDSGIISPAVKGDERSYALQLVQHITEEQHQRWSEGTLITWVNEGREVAARTIYGELPHSGTLPDDYETKALPIVNEQLERAGVRLATLLNKALP